MHKFRQTLLPLFAIGAAVALSPAALCGEIWIQSQTQIIAPSLPYRDGAVAVRLLDDANRPIPDAAVGCIIADNAGFSANKQSYTDAGGVAVFPFELSPGSYRARVQYDGSDNYGQSSADFDFRFEACKQNARLDAPAGTVFNIPSPIKLVLSRQNCLDRSADWIVSFDGDSKRIRIPAGASSADISFPSKNSENGSHRIAADAINARGIEDESVQKEIFASDAKNNASCEFEFKPAYIRARCMLSDSFRRWLLRQNAECALSYLFFDNSEFIPNAIHPPYNCIKFILGENLSNIKSKTADNPEFFIPRNNSSQMMYALQCPPNSAAAAQGRIAVPDSRFARYFRIAALLCGLAFVLFAGARLAQKSVAAKKVKIPSPKSQTPPEIIADSDRVSAMPRRRFNRSKQTCTVYCYIDDPFWRAGEQNNQSRLRSVAPSELAVTPPIVQTDGANAFQAPCGAHAVIMHEAAVPWKGIIPHCDCVKIVLTTRRQYICDCFCRVANHLLKTGDVSWGTLAPEQLLREFNAIANLRSAQNKKISPELESFCKNVSEATFGCTPITRDQVDAIYGQSKRLVSKRV